MKERPHKYEIVLSEDQSFLLQQLATHSKQVRWQQRTPAMAAGLTAHIWTVKELLHLALVPLTTNT